MICGKGDNFHGSALVTSMPLLTNTLEELPALGASPNLSRPESIMRDGGVALEQTAQSVRGRARHVTEFAHSDRWRQVNAKRATEVTEHVIKVFGDAAFSTGRVVVTLSGDGEPSNRFAGHFVHLFQRDASGWKDVSAR